MVLPDGGGDNGNGDIVFYYWTNDSVPDRVVDNTVFTYVQLEIIYPDKIHSGNAWHSHETGSYYVYRDNKYYPLKIF